MDSTATLASEFKRETHRIEQMIWDAMALQAGESVLFCGFSNNVDWIKRAIAIGVDVSVVANESTGIAQLDDVAVTVLRGSSSMLPARDASYDASVAFHYLHEVDPFFHANIVSELGRVAKRTIIVEPAPPRDPLGQRIAMLYSRAKREFGQFENYHPIDYWRKLLSIVKSNVSYQTFTFTRTPPREAMRETVALVIDMMAAEETPEPYLAELRALAKRPDAQLLPQARYVVVGTAGVVPATRAGTTFREHDEADLRPPLISPFAGVVNAVRGTSGPLPAGSGAPSGTSSRVYSAPNAEPEFPAVEPPKAASPARPGVDLEHVARNAFGLTSSGARKGPTAPSVSDDDLAADGFGLAGSTPAEAATEFGWEWEPPEKP
jgi:hypothetical protein